MRETIIGVMGPGSGASKEVTALAEEVGELIAKKGWTLLTGGRSVGVMEAASRGAKSSGGRTIGVLPFKDFESGKISSSVDVVILTGIGEARNVINVLTSQVVIACGMGSGTASEVALALKAKRPVVLLTRDKSTVDFFCSLGGTVQIAQSPHEAIEMAAQLLNHG